MMEQRKKLYDYSMCVMFLSVLNLFMFCATMVTAYVDGTIAEALKLAPAEYLGAVKIFLYVIMGLEVLLLAAQFIIGRKGMKVSKEPTAAKGYITWAKVFLVLSILSVLSIISDLVDPQLNASVFDMALNLVNAVLDVIIYIFFIKAANAVRKSVANSEN